MSVQGGGGSEVEVEGVKKGVGEKFLPRKGEGDFASIFQSKRPSGRNNPVGDRVIECSEEKKSVNLCKIFSKSEGRISENVPQKQCSAKNRRCKSDEDEVVQRIVGGGDNVSRVSQLNIGISRRCRRFAVGGFSATVQSAKVPGRMLR